MSVELPNSKLIKDVVYAVLEDLGIMAVVWGKARLGKSTLQMRVAYWVYKYHRPGMTEEELWQMVLDSWIWNLGGFLYKMKNGLPCKIYEKKQRHNRIPIVLWDDFGAHSNKAVTQHSAAWDEFKGGADVIFTKVTTILASMLDPTEPTFQLMNKFTHEIYLPSKGVYKYDEVDWQQDYSGWHMRKNKDWQETNTFDECPEWVYNEYDEMRMSLADEVEQRINDAENLTIHDNILTKLQPNDIELLKLVRTKGLLRWNELVERLPNHREPLIRCKARGLIIPVKNKSSYNYDLTNLGVEVVKKLEEKG